MQKSKYPRTGRSAGIKALICIILFPLLTAVSSAQNNEPREQTWCTNGPVNAMARYGDTIIIGGGFTSVYPYTGHGLPIGRPTGEFPASYAKITGTTESVTACVSDGSSGWYIGGNFSKVGGTSKHSLAHIFSDGSLDNAWDVGTTGTISALAITSSTLYVGGWFTRIGRAPRKNIAALDIATGLSTNWNPGADRGISALAISGQTIYVGGDFKNIGGQPRSCISALDTSTGLATSWNPSAEDQDSSWPSVETIAVSGSAVYVGGYFTKIGGQNRTSIAAIDTSTSLATAWDPKAEGYVPGKPNGYSYTPTIRALAVSSSTAYSSPTIYVGGDFTKIGGQERKYLAGLDAFSGTATLWRPSPWYLEEGAKVTAVALSERDDWFGSYTVYVGAEDGMIGAYNSSSGNRNIWDFGSGDGSVDALAISGSNIYAGGRFNYCAGKARNAIAAINATTGRATSWNPDIRRRRYYLEDPGGAGSVYSILATSSTIYAGGSFDTVGNQLRRNIVAINASSGYATLWKPRVYVAEAAVDSWDYSCVYSMVLSGSTLYAGGIFTRVNDTVRNCIAAIDASTAFATSWDPSPTRTLTGYDYYPPLYPEVRALALSGPTLYVGGKFNRIGSQPRNSVAALDTVTGLATPWNPTATYSTSESAMVYNLAIWGSTVYVGGGFRSMGGKARNGIAALDATTGLATPWDPGATYTTTQSATVRSIALSPSTVYAAGWFTGIGRTARSGVAALDAGSGKAMPWDPTDFGFASKKDSYPYIMAFLPFGQTVYVGGGFMSIGGLPQSNFVQFDNVPPAPTASRNWALFK